MFTLPGFIPVIPNLQDSILYTPIHQTNWQDLILYKDNNIKGYKTKDFEINDNIGLHRFTQRIKQAGKRAKLVDPETKQYIEKDKAVNSGSGPHACYWKLYDKIGNRIGTVTEDGRWKRE